MTNIKRTYSNGLKLEFIACYQPLIRYFTKGEKFTEEWMIKNVKKTWTALDIGAHIGSFAMPLSILAKQVVAVEANPEAIEMLKQNIAHNTHLHKNIDIIQAVIGDKCSTEQRTLWYAGTNKHSHKTAVTDDFEMVTIDTLCIKYDIAPDVIKIDIDGWDLEALWGAVETIDTHRPFLVVELNRAMYRRKHTHIDIIDFLVRHSYICLEILDSPRNWILSPRERMSEAAPSDAKRDAMIDRINRIVNCA